MFISCAQLATAYPQAIYFPFRISSENLSAKAQAVIEPLQRVLANPLLEQFTEALAKLTHPEHRWKDWSEHLKQALLSRDQKRIRDVWRLVWADCFDAKAPRIGSYSICACIC